MERFGIIKRNLASIFVYTPEKLSFPRKIAYFCFSVLTFIVLLFTFVVTLFHFVKIKSTNIEDPLHEVFQMAANISLVYRIVFLLILRRNVTKTINDLPLIRLPNQSTDSHTIMETASNQSDRICKIYYTCFLILFPGNIFVSGVKSVLLSLYQHGELISDEVWRPFNFLLPWNQHTLAGYVAEMAVSVVWTIFYVVVNGTILLFYISLCLQHRAFCDIFRLTVDELTTKRDKHALICDLIRFHITIKQWFLDSAKVYSWIVMIQLFFSTLSTALSVYAFDMKLHDLDTSIVNTFVEIVVALANLFIYCYFGMKATESFEETSELLYDVDWLDLPVKLQKYFILMILNMQQPVYYDGFGIAVMNLETFQRFAKMIYTCYMMFKKLSH